jgi:cyclophilin family peptidyl-prolyl cis-trans isomerase
MAANSTGQLSTANTFNHWLTATQYLIGLANTLTNGNGSTFYANTRLEVGGSSGTLNVVTSATINTQFSNNITTSNLTAGNVIISYNVATLNVTNKAYVGTDLAVYGNATIGGDLTVSGNITLDTIGFDDLSVAGSANIANTLTVTGNSSFSNASASVTFVTPNAFITTANITTGNISGTLYVGGNSTFSNANVTQVLVANIAQITTATITTANITTANVITLVGAANTGLYAAIANAGGDVAVAMAIALG